MGTNQFTLVLLSLLLFIGCASIPKESPELSHEVGERISAMKEAHLNLVQQYFDLKKEEVKETFEEEWIPAYAESFFSNPETKSYWNSLVEEGDEEERLNFLIQAGPTMLREIREKQNEFLKPLNELESQVEDSLRKEYEQMLSANNTLTSFLSGAAEVAENRQQYLDLFGVQSEAVNNQISKVDERSEEIMKKIKEANIN